MVSKIKGRCPYCGSPDYLYILCDKTIHCNSCGHFSNAEDVVIETKRGLDRWLANDHL